ncbi:hypothetical protein [Bacillus sp. T3]|uniref:hypothetical protein n=1 Tax=Bacillus sp. T3 TaxID=467262 RepID=UPI0029829801|nr:hypothetical protein [Bacillus sp. T3]
MSKEKVYERPLVLSHQSIAFETSQSWNQGHGPVSNDPGDSNGESYPLEPYTPKKDHPKKN